MKKTVNYLGIQKCEKIMPDFVLVNILCGKGKDTIAFKPNKHKVDLNDDFNEKIYYELGENYFKQVGFLGI